MGGGVFCKKVNLSSMQGALCTVSVFFILHFTYLGGGCVRTQRTPCLRACYSVGERTEQLRRGPLRCLVYRRTVTSLTV